jgi:16S rRNA G966 N2-methylase RsmD
MSDNISLQLNDWIKLYKIPLPSSRTGALYNAFSYPTKISPEAIALFVACHTKPGDTVIDPFAGSGTTGLAAKLCDCPTESMTQMARDLGLKPVWGKRTAVLYEISAVGAFASDVMCNPPDPAAFKKAADELIEKTSVELEDIYWTTDPNGHQGTIRYTVWSEVLKCPECKKETSFWKAAVRQDPLNILTDFTCPKCSYTAPLMNIPRELETVWDNVLGKKITAKKRIPVKIYGRTEKKTWSRELTTREANRIVEKSISVMPPGLPVYPLHWGVLYRKGYHTGITHLHHLYTRRNALVFSTLWGKVNTYPSELRPSLKLLLLSYNASHSTLMTRVVVKKNNPDLVITGSQSGVLYISNLPVEKNILDGLKRKITTLSQAFSIISPSRSKVIVHNSSSTRLDLPDESIDYIFTDPPFGDYIPYSEINQINEAWLGKLTETRLEAIVNTSQKKGVTEYKELIRLVFSELNRVLKTKACFSLVFHSSKAEIWQAISEVIQHSDFKLATSGILDKVQASFKQVVSTHSTQGDPLMLLYKSTVSLNSKISIPKPSDRALIKKIISQAYKKSGNDIEQKSERLYSRFINACLKSGRPVSMDLKDFNAILENELADFEYAN